MTTIILYLAMLLVISYHGEALALVQEGYLTINPELI
jgi:hypothetical protein